MLGLAVGLNIHFGQSCEAFVQRSPASASHLEIIQTVTVKKKGKEDFEEAHKELTRSLRLAMSEQIITEVKSTSTMTVSDNDGVFNEYFGASTSTSSNTKIGRAHV